MTTENNESLELRYRPLSFDELIGWKKEKESLLSILDTKRTFLLYGQRGCGKTTIGRLIAYQLEIDDIDITEIDAATNTGVDDARLIKQNASFFPLKSKKKIYIIDEVHRLTGNAFDALLKTLEEPPSHCYFVLVTSEINKVPETIKSRCAKYQVAPLDNTHSLELLNWICSEEKIEISDNVKQAIIDQCEGIPREMVVSLDMVKNMKSDEDAITLICSSIKNTQVIELCRALLKKSDWKLISSILKGLTEEPESIRYAILGYMNAVLMKDDNRDAAMIMMNFTDSFIYSKKAGLTLACYMSVKD